MEKKLGLIGHNGGPPLDDLGLDIDPNEIIRRELGHKYFGLKRSQLDQQIKDGKIPRPFPLVEGGRATGWLGRQIIKHHQKRIAARLELSGLESAHRKGRAVSKKKEAAGI
jgi:predicted DNA-binding transcriptional regulator AlpA